MLKPFLRKRIKILKGIYRTYVKRQRNAYAHSWWDDQFYYDEINDRSTISANFDNLSATYHYASVELLVIRHLIASGKSLNGISVCDIGAGAGHWVNFYCDLGVASVSAIDVSRKACAFLQNKFAGVPSVEIYQGTALSLLKNTSRHFDLVNAIGVMFHIIDDYDWSRTIRQIAASMKPGGVLVVSGHFGLVDGVNVQFGNDGSVNKRLRSARHWKYELRAAGFTGIRIERNYSHLRMNLPLPENNVLMALRS